MFTQSFRAVNIISSMVFASLTNITIDGDYIVDSRCELVGSERKRVLLRVRNSTTCATVELHMDASNV